MTFSYLLFSHFSFFVQRSYSQSQKSKQILGCLNIWITSYMSSVSNLSVVCNHKTPSSMPSQRWASTLADTIGRMLDSDLVSDLFTTFSHHCFVVQRSCSQSFFSRIRSKQNTWFMDSELYVVCE
jgi:hypothetical protein